MSDVERSYGAWWLDSGVSAHDPLEAARKLVEMLNQYLSNPDLHCVDWNHEPWEDEDGEL